VSDLKARLAQLEKRQPTNPMQFTLREHDQPCERSEACPMELGTCSVCGIYCFTIRLGERDFEDTDDE
jgi:hypothetical protein